MEKLENPWLNVTKQSLKTVSIKPGINGTILNLSFSDECFPRPALWKLVYPLADEIIEKFNNVPAEEYDSFMSEYFNEREQNLINYFLANEEGIEIENLTHFLYEKGIWQT